MITKLIIGVDCIFEFAAVFEIIFGEIEGIDDSVAIEQTFIEERRKKSRSNVFNVAKLVDANNDFDCFVQKTLSKVPGMTTVNEYNERVRKIYK